MFSARRGLERSLRGYLSFCGGTALGLHLGSGPGASVRSESRRCEFFLKAPDARAPPNSRLGWNLIDSDTRLSWPGGAAFGCFSCLEAPLWHRHQSVGSLREAGLEPTTAGKPGRIDFRAKKKDKALVGLNVLVKVSLLFQCFLSVAKSIPSVFLLPLLLSSGVLGR